MPKFLGSCDLSIFFLREETEEGLDARQRADALWKESMKR